MVREALRLRLTASLDAVERLTGVVLAAAGHSEYGLTASELVALSRAVGEAIVSAGGLRALDDLDSGSEPSTPSAVKPPLPWER